MSFKLRNKDGKLPLLWAIAIGFSLSFAICLALTLSTPIAGQLLFGDVILTEDAQKVVVATAAMATIWWWLMVSIIGIAITMYVSKGVFLR